MASIQTYFWNGKLVGAFLIMEWTRQHGCWTFAQHEEDGSTYLEIGERYGDRIVELHKDMCLTFDGEHFQPRTRDWLYSHYAPEEIDRKQQGEYLSQVLIQRLSDVSDDELFTIAASLGTERGQRERDKHIQIDRNKRQQGIL